MVLLRIANRIGFGFKHIDDKIIRNKKQDKAERGVVELFNYRGAFSYKYTLGWIKVIGTIRGMPYFASFHYVDDIIMMAPGILKSIFERTIKNGNKRLTAAKLPELAGIPCYVGIHVIHKAETGGQQIYIQICKFDYVADLAYDGDWFSCATGDWLLTQRL